MEAKLEGNQLGCEIKENREANTKTDEERDKYEKVDSMKNVFTLISLNSLAAIDTMDFGLPAAFFPYLSKQRGYNAFFTSIIFATFPLFYFLGHAFISKRLTTFDRKQTLLLVVLTGSFCKLCFGCLEFVENEVIFGIIAVSSRILVGLTSAINLSIILSLISEIWPDDKIRKVALFDTINTMGYAAGPWIGSLFYYIGGYICVFAMSALMTIMFGFYIVYFVIKREFTITEKTLEFFKGFFHIKVIMNFLLTTFLYGSFCFIAPAFENHMVIDLKQTPVVSSMVYGIHLVGCVLSLIFINNFYNEKYRRYLILIGGSLNICCEFFLGPDTLFGITGITNQMVVIGFAMLFLGTANGMTIILIMQDFHDAYEEIFPDNEDLRKNLANGAYLASFGSGEFFGVLMGGIMIDSFGYKRANSVYGLFILVFFISYWIWFVFKNKRNHVILKEEKEEA